MLAMRSFAFIMMLAGASVQTAAVEPSCMIDSSKAVNELLDSALYIWAAIERCGKSGKELTCAVDVASVIKSVSKMVQLILDTIDECSIIKGYTHACDADILDLTQAVAGLVKYSTDIAVKCPKHEAPAPVAPAPAAPAPPAPVPSDPCAPSARKLSGLCSTQRRLGLTETHYRAATCAIEVKSSMTSVAKAVTKIMGIQDKCGAPGAGYSWECNNDAVDLVIAIADMATFILGAVSHCARIQMDVGLACASSVSGLMAKLLDVSKAGDGIAQHCMPAPETTAAPVVPTPQPTVLVPTPVPTPVTAQPTILVPTPVPTPVPAPRLYAKDGASVGAPKETSTMTLTLVALMPVTAIASFFVGSRFARSTPNESAAREIE